MSQVVACRQSVSVTFWLVLFRVPQPRKPCRVLESGSQLSILQLSPRPFVSCTQQFSLLPLVPLNPKRPIPPCAAAAQDQPLMATACARLCQPVPACASLHPCTGAAGLGQAWMAQGSKGQLWAWHSSTPALLQTKRPPPSWAF